MTDIHDRDTIPPPPLGGVKVPTLLTTRDEPAIDATDRAWALYFAKVARELAARSVTLTIPLWLSLVFVILAVSAVVDIVFRLWRMGHP